MKTHLFSFERLLSAVLGVALLNVIIGGAVYGADYNYNIPTGEETVNGNLANIDANPSRLTKSGAGTLILNGANTYTGGTLLTGGTIVLGNNKALGTWQQNGDGTDNTAFMNSQGIVTVTDNVTTIKVLEDRTIFNHFVIGIPEAPGLTGNCTGSLTFDIATDTTLTIDGVVNTSGNFYLNKGGAINVNVSGLTGLNFTGGHLIFSNNQAYDGGAVGIFGTLNGSLNFTGLQSITFSGNSANGGGGGGGAIWAAGFITLGDNATFSGNSANTGGGIWSISSVTLGNNAIFSGNTAYAGGGIWANDSVTLGDNATFSNNSANNGYGGGFYAAVSATVGSYATFSGNLVIDNHGGGGICSGADGLIDIATHAYFVNNQARKVASGGAINAASAVSIHGDSFFSGNLTGADGGAIFARGLSASTVLLDTTDGVIAFSGNQSGVTDFTAPDGTANAIHLNANTQLKMTGSGNVYFDDPISGGNLAGNSVLLDTGFTGFVQFKGDSVLLGDASTTLNGGTMRVVDGASYTNGSGVFTVDANATLAGGGTIAASNGFVISGTITPDSDSFAIPTYTTKNDVTADEDYNYFGTEITTVDSTKKIGTLTLTGDVTLDGATLAIDINTLTGTPASDLISVTGDVNFGATENTVNLTSIDDWTNLVLVEAANMTGNADEYFNAVTVGGSALSSRQTATLNILDNNLLLTTTTGENLDLQWIAGESGTWTTIGDWTIVGDTGTDSFNANDSVVFDSTSTWRTVAVDLNGVTVSGMKVDSGDYTFSGGSITGTTSAKGDNATKTGRLDIAAGASGTFSNDISFVNDIANDGALIFNRTDAFTLDSEISGSGVTKMTGTGTLTLSGTNTQVNGFVQENGTVNLTKTWTGDYTQSGGTLTSSGTARITGDAVLKGTVTPTGTLKITGDAMFDGATINIGSLASANTITVDGNADFTGTTINLDASGAITGTYMLINYDSCTLDDITVAASNLGANLAGKWTFGNTGLTYEIYRVLQLRDQYGQYLSTNGYRMAGLIDRLPLTHPFYTAIDALSDDVKIISAIENATGEVFADSMQGGANLQRIFNRSFPKRKGIGHSLQNQAVILGQCGSRCPDYEIWGQFTGGSHDRSSIGRYSGYDLSNYGVAFGFEKQLSNHWFGGVAFGYDNAHLDLDRRYAKDEFEAFRVSLYGGYTGDNWYTSGYAGYAKNWHDTNRNNPAAGFRNHAKYDDDLFSTGFELGRIYQMTNGSQLLPSVGIHWIHLDSPEFTERGSAASALHVSKSHYDTVQLPIGARLNKTFTSRSLCPWSITWTPEVRAFYVAELSDERSGLYTAFASAAGAGSVYADSGSGGRNGGMFGAGVTVQLTTRISVGVDYDYEIWETYDRHNLLGSVVWRR